MDAGHDCRPGDSCRKKGKDVCGSAGVSEAALDIQTPFPFRVLRVSGISLAHGMGEEIDVLHGKDGVLKNIKIMQEVRAGSDFSRLVFLICETVRISFIHIILHCELPDIGM